MGSATTFRPFYSTPEGTSPFIRKDETIIS